MIYFNYIDLLKPKIDIKSDKTWVKDVRNEFEVSHKFKKILNNLNKIKTAIGIIW